MQRTDIEYLTHTWNPIAMRCTPVSAGCAHCWHLRMCKRFAANPKLPAAEREAYAGGPPVLREKELAAPLRVRKPAVIGVQFMGDLFHEGVSDLDIDMVFTHMAWSDRHTFLVLTKRPKRMSSWVNEWVHQGLPEQSLYGTWPLPNVWLGVSIEDQATADERIPWLLQTPAVKHFVSYEPALGPVRIDELGIWLCHKGTEQGIDLVIAGGETGPGARPDDATWYRSVRDQCRAASVPFFFKQMAGKAPTPDDLVVREWPR